QLLATFANCIAASQAHRLSGNFRSSAKICAVAERLIPTEPPMQAVGENAGFGVAPVHDTWDTALEGIVNRFLPAAHKLGVPFGEIALLAPWWQSLFHIGRALRARGVPVMGPGARAYRRSHLLAPLLENIGAYLEEPAPDIAVAVQRSVFLLLAQLS